MNYCKHCGRIRDEHIGLRETCPGLPAQRFEAKPTDTRTPEQQSFAAWLYEYLSKPSTE